MGKVHVAFDREDGSVTAVTELEEARTYSYVLQIEWDIGYWRVHIVLKVIPWFWTLVHSQQKEEFMDILLEKYLGE